MKLREQENLADAMKCLDFWAPDLTVTHDEDDRRKIAGALWNFAANVIATSMENYARDPEAVDHVRSMLIDPHWQPEDTA